MQRLDFRAMGCYMLALIDSTNPDATEALALVPTWFEEWENVLSRFRDNSELSALNRADGKPFQASETLFLVLQASLQAAQDSAGLVTPTLLDAVQAAGYDRSFDALAKSMERATIAAEIFDWHSIELDEKNRTVRLPRGMHLDFGGIAKGWAADQAAARLSAIAPALVDAGGDIAISARQDNEEWSIGIADPFRPESDLELLMVECGGVATSGRDYRRWQRNGKWQHHIINPRTGEPADTDVLSATVIAPTTQQAEVAAKTALILGSRAGMEWLERHETLAGLFVLEDGTIVRSSTMERYLWREPVVLN
ncbi:MAG: FAD:protein FMN transferase [Chloroflexi bacterium]|nr:FAD:protein FMN transferase [Chloroflexota bacterium]